MAVLAVGLAKVETTNTIAPDLVFAVGHWLKVIGVHACLVTAQVVKLQPFRDRPHDQFVAVTVGVRLQPLAVADNRKLPVAIWLDELSGSRLRSVSQRLHRLNGYNHRQHVPLDSGANPLQGDCLRLFFRPCPVPGLLPATVARMVNPDPPRFPFRA